MKGPIFFSAAALSAKFLFAACIFAACAIPADLAHMEAPKILFFSPPGEYVLPEETEEIRVGFSREMRRAVTEGAFSLRRDSSPVPGTFSWEDGGRTLVFIPLAPLSEKSSYTLKLSSAAEDRYGNSLGPDFSRTFHTRPEREAPRVLSAAPSPGSWVSPKESVRFVFSEPMAPRETESVFSLSPGLPGYFTWNEAGDSLEWTPMEDYKPGGLYTASLGRAAQDLAGNSLPEDFSLRFSARENSVEVLSVRTRWGEVPPVGDLGGALEDPSLRIEKDEEFRILFSAAPGRENRDSPVSINPNAPVTARWEEGFTELGLSFPEGLPWNGIFELRVLKTIYRFRVNGENSVPLGVSRVVYIEDILAEPPVRRELILARDYPFPSSSDAAFDIYISHGPGATPVFASFLSAFSAEPGTMCLEIDPRRVEIGPVHPPCLPSPGSGETVFRVHCGIHSLPASGTLTLRLGTELRDDRNNGLPEAYTLRVNKP
jgi:hypothetical protein